MLRLSCFLSFVRCEFQCKSSCSIIPKYLTCDEVLIFWPLMRKLRCLVMILFLGWNITRSVLLVFEDSLFALIHWATNFRFLFICLFIFFIDKYFQRNNITSYTRLNIIGPVLFNIFFNDFFCFILVASAHNFADDKTLSSFATTIRGRSRDFEKGRRSISVPMVGWQKSLGFRWSKKVKIAFLAKYILHYF